jgi:hypothetical protein
MNSIPTRLLAKAAACASKDRDRKHLGVVLICRQWIQATDGHIAFRAPSLVDIEGWVSLRPKRKLPQSVDEVHLDLQDIGMSPVMTEGVPRGRLLEWFEAGYHKERPVFPNLDNVWPARCEKVTVSSILFDPTLLIGLTLHDPDSIVGIQLGDEAVDPVLLWDAHRNSLDTQRWEAVIMPCVL